MATLNVPYNGVNAPGAASFTPPQINDAAIANLPKNFYEGQQAQHQLAVQNAFQDGLPKDANGNPDFQAAAMRLFQLGQPEQATALLNTAISQQGMRNSSAFNNMLLNGASPAGTSTPSGPSASSVVPASDAAPQDFYAANHATEGSVTDPKFSNGTAAGVTQITQDTWDGVRAEHPELKLPPEVTDATADQQKTAERAITYHNTGWLAQNGITVNDKNARMAYFLGSHGGVHFLSEFSRNPAAPAAPMFPAEAKNNPGAFYNIDPATGKPGPGGGSKTLFQVMQDQTARFGNGNTTGFNPPVAPRGQVAGPGAPSQFGGPIARAADGTPVPTNAQGQAIDPRTGQPTQPTLVARGTAPPIAVSAANAATAAQTAAPSAGINLGTLGATQRGLNAANGASSPTWKNLAANDGQPAQGDESTPASQQSSYAQNLAKPPPANQPAAQPVAPAPSPAAGSQAAGSPPAASGPLDPTLGGLVPPGLVARFKAQGLPPDQWAGTAATYLTAAAGSPGTPPASAEAYRQLAGEIGQTLRMRSTPNPAIKEIEYERQIDPETGQMETPTQTLTRVAAEKATATGTAEARAKANVELGTAGPIAEAKKQYETLGELPGKLADAANAAKLQNSMLDEMQGAAANFRMGWGAEAVQHANSIIQGLYQMAGIDSSGVDTKVGSYQDFVKLSGGFLRQAAHETSSRVGVQEMQLISKSLPSPEMSPDGFALIAPQIKALGDMSIAKQQAAASWAAAHNNSLAGFQVDWNKNVSPAAFVFHRMANENPTAFQTMVTNMVTQPGGKTVLKNIRNEMTWADSNRLFGQ